jgi:nicotinamidase-related amidase
MSKIVQLIPSRFFAEDIKSIINNDLIAKSRLEPFSELAINFLNQLSKEILTDSLTSRMPELVALAYFLRKANIKKMVDNFQSTLPDSEIVVPLGICFQIAPSNVDTIFMYSWAFSLLAGNTNIIRITQNVGEQLSSLLSVINRVINFSDMKEIAVRNKIISYSYDENINSHLSSIADLRILWGGNNTVQSIRKHLAKPTTRDIAFADKISYAAIDSVYLLSLNESELNEKVRLFYNDSYYFDQLACSSPQVVFFVGNNDENERASSFFWTKLEELLKKIQHNEHVSVRMNKLAYLYEESANGMDLKILSDINSSKPAIVEIKKNDINRIENICGGGYFHQCFINDLTELQDTVKENDQTLSYIGFNSEILKNLAKLLNGKGIDRIVPVGQALAFMQTWDGFSLLNHFTKRVVVI